MIAGRGAGEKWWANVRAGFCEEGAMMQGSELRARGGRWPPAEAGLSSNPSVPSGLQHSRVGKPSGTRRCYLKLRKHVFLHVFLHVRLPQVFSLQLWELSSAGCVMWLLILLKQSGCEVVEKCLTCFWRDSCQVHFWGSPARVSPLCHGTYLLLLLLAFLPCFPLLPVSWSSSK